MALHVGGGLQQPLAQAWLARRWPPLLHVRAWTAGRSEKVDRGGPAAIGGPATRPGIEGEHAQSRLRRAGLGCRGGLLPRNRSPAWSESSSARPTRGFVASRSGADRQGGDRLGGGRGLSGVVGDLQHQGAAAQGEAGLERPRFLVVLKRSCTSPFFMAPIGAGLAQHLAHQGRLQGRCPVRNAGCRWRGGGSRVRQQVPARRCAACRRPTEMKTPPIAAGWTPPAACSARAKA